MPNTRLLCRLRRYSTGHSPIVAKGQRSQAALAAFTVDKQRFLSRHSGQTILGNKLNLRQGQRNGVIDVPCFVFEDFAHVYQSRP